MPLLFAVTLFVSASLLFMVQPMVGKMILPLLGGSPAVWNACMVFFQVLLLLGYLYAHWMSTRHDPKSQGWLHSLILLGAIAVFVLSVAFGARHTPIAIAEGLAPTDGANPFFAVLALLLVAIGFPFFVASTSAPLLQRWFSFTGHPSSRDPYFLYAASNVGSLVSLLGYPLFIEPHMTINQQAWFFAVGFGVLAVLIVACGRAAANPIGVPPGSKNGNGAAGKSSKPGAVDVTAEPPPSPLRIAKWILLAFVPSSFMLAVTFHMSTDIASIPLLWVFPLALYLVTFIIAFSTLVPPWFRQVLGNVTPIMLLLLVFVMVSGITGGKIALTLSIHIAAFFFAALMCHYELARDRPKDVTHLTQYFVWMSVGGMLGGMFNGIFAPLVFTYAHEYPYTIVFACGMVPVFVAQAGRAAEKLFPNLTGTTSEVAEWLATAGASAAVFLVCLGLSYVLLVQFVQAEKLGNYWYLVALFPAWFVMWQWRRLMTKTYEASANPEELPMEQFSRLAKKTNFRTALDMAVPLTMACVFWWLSYLHDTRNAESVFYSITKRASTSLSGIGVDEPTAAAILAYGFAVFACFFFVDRPVRFALCVAAILGIHYHRESQNERIIYTDRSFFGILKVESQGYFTRLVHGTTLHGTQINEYYVVRADAPIVFGVFSPWDVLAVEGALNRWDPRQEPLTYYHRTGPVGAMFYESRTRAIAEGRNPASDKVAMVGLGTGSASCYALKGQELDFYEIDPAVRKIVETPWKVMNQEAIDEAKARGAAVPDPLMGPITYVQAARDRGGIIDFKMGDARLKLRDYTGQKYSLLLVDAFSSDAIPVHLLTKEAVEMYMTKITDHGLLALHISNKYVRLEPVVAGIAQELGLKARVWNDDSESRPGKTASSWCILARTEADLGVLGKTAVEQAKAFGTRNEPLVYLLNKYGADKNAMEAIMTEWGGPEAERGKLTPTLMSIREGPQAAVLYQYAIRMRDAGKTGKDANLEALSGYIFGPIFHDVRVLKDVPLWTDDYSDVLRVIMIPQVQKVRGWFGLPTPVKE